MAFTPHQTCLLEFFFQVARMRGGGHLHLHNQLVSCGLADIDNIHVPVFSRVESESGGGREPGWKEDVTFTFTQCSFYFYGLSSVLDKESFDLKVLVQ